MNLMWIKTYRNILIGAGVCLALAVTGIPLWLYKNEQKTIAASEAYSSALKNLKKDDPASEKQTRDTLEKIDLSMAKLYAAHLSFKLGEIDRAAKSYETFLAGAQPKDPLRPLALMALKGCYESLAQPEKVKKLNQELEKLGFSEK